jgi:hypothetical protein
VSADVIISSIGDFFAAVAVVGALGALRYAGESAQSGERAMVEAERMRRAAEVQQEYFRLIRVGELVEVLHGLPGENRASSFDDQANWSRTASQLRIALVGFGRAELPLCRQLAQHTRRVDEHSTAGEARNEVADAIEVLLNDWYEARADLDSPSRRSTSWLERTFRRVFRVK